MMDCSIVAVRAPFLFLRITPRRVLVGTPVTTSFRDISRCRSSCAQRAVPFNTHRLPIGDIVLHL